MAPYDDEKRQHEKLVELQHEINKLWNQQMAMSHQIHHDQGLNAKQSQWQLCKELSRSQSLVWSEDVYGPYPPSADLSRDRSIPIQMFAKWLERDWNRYVAGIANPDGEGNSKPQITGGMESISAAQDFSSRLRQTRDTAETASNKQSDLTEPSESEQDTRSISKLSEQSDDSEPGRPYPFILSLKMLIIKGLFVSHPTDLKRKEFDLTQDWHWYFVLKPTEQSSAPVQQIAQMCNVRWDFISSDGKLARHMWTGRSQDITNDMFQLLSEFGSQFKTVEDAHRRGTAIPKLSMIQPHDDTARHILTGDNEPKEVFGREHRFSNTNIHVSYTFWEPRGFEALVS